ncbi:MAG: hypothetical protein C0594_06370 [Marinilabiliales bacterium]|nr:MAG: hypothetical protein C0594_06370 [Marinilabiliales bacterium]
MKKLLIVLILIVPFRLAFSQEEPNSSEYKTLLGNVDHFGAFNGLCFKVGPVHEEVGLMMGGNMAFIFNHRFMLGVAGYGLTTRSDFRGVDFAGLDTSLTVGMGYGGLLLKYNFFPTSPIHFSVPVLVGAGGSTVKYRDAEWYTNFEDNLYKPMTVENTSYLVVEPGLNVELNLTRWARFSIGVSYRYIYGSSLKNLSDAQLSDYAVNANLKLGYF